MDIEVLIGILGVFTSGLGIGAGATLFTQWAHKKLTWHPPEMPLPSGQELSGLQGDLDDLTKAVLNLNQRMEFQEHLMSGKAHEEVGSGVDRSG